MLRLGTQRGSSRGRDLRGLMHKLLREDVVSETLPKGERCKGIEREFHKLRMMIDGVYIRMNSNIHI